MKVTEIRFEMVVDDKRVVAAFLRPEKVADLLEDEGSLGEFLRDLRDSAKKQRHPAW